MDVLFSCQFPDPSGVVVDEVTKGSEQALPRSSRPTRFGKLACNFSKGRLCATALLVDIDPRRSSRSYMIVRQAAVCACACSRVGA